MDLQDGQIYAIANYLTQVPNLRSLNISGNSQITDDGMYRLAQSLQKNNKLAHLNICGLNLLTDDALSEIIRSLENFNMMICVLEFDLDKFDPDLTSKVLKETKLNRAIQEQLKPTFFSSKNSVVESSKKQAGEASSLRYSEIAFVEGAPVDKVLGSAIKCWRITMPTQIQIENQNLTDAHILELIDFLQDRNMLTHLNIRRNLVTNVGASAII